jgi:recombination associated protein RdgC
MALRSGSVSLARFRTAPPKQRGADLKRLVLKGLRAHRFEPLDPERGEEDRAAGFVELEDPVATGFTGDVLQGDLALFAWRVDTLKVPGAEVKAALARWTSAFVAEQGRPPARREKAVAADGFKQALRRKVAPSSRVHDVAWDLRTGELQVWAGSRKAVEEIAAAVAGAFEVKPLPLTPGARADETGLAEGKLRPTPALFGPIAGGQGVDRGEA